MPKPTDISVVDDFLCQECTEWSGLGALEILASVLNLPPERRADLLSWSERHNAVYKVLSGNEDVIEVRNLINNCTYRVRMNLERNPFHQGLCVHGSLVPWDGEWYWSGAQTTLGRLDAATIARLKSDYRKLPSIYYRYSPVDLEKARGLVREQYEAFVARHGKDWVAYPDGLAMAADWQKEMREKVESLSPAKKREFKKKHGSRSPMPEMSIPEDLLDSDNGIGVYFNPDEGQEIVQDFNDILSGMGKRGADLTPAEGDALRGWVWSEEISPGFVRRLADEFGGESVNAAFVLGGRHEDYALEYALRRYKGRFYRPRYPTLSIVK